MAVQLEGTTGSIAEVIAGALQVNTPTDVAAAGFAAQAAEADPGTVTGTRLIRPLEVTSDYRLRVGTDGLLFNDQFVGSALNNGNYLTFTSTMTVAVANGFLILNNASNQATTINARVQSTRCFPVYGTFPLYAEFYFQYGSVGTTQQNTVIEFGIANATTNNTTPLDGAIFRYDVTGSLVGVLISNGVELPPVSLGNAPAINETHHYLVTMTLEGVEFWVDDVLCGTITRPAAAPAPTFASQLGILLRQYNTGAVPQPTQARFSQITLTLGDIGNARPWMDVLTGMGAGGYQTQQSNGAGGQTANFANSAAPATAGLANGTASYTTLGGQFQFNAVAGAETDYALFGFQVPAVSSTSIGKLLRVRGIVIDTIVLGAAIATTNTTLQWGIGVDSTSASLATTDAVNAKSPRRLFLGYQTFLVGDAIGTQGRSPIYIPFNAPLDIAPGNYLIVILRVIAGTATASQVFRGGVMIDSQWE